MSEEKRVKEVKLEIPGDLYVGLERLAREEGYSNVTEYLISVIKNLVTSNGRVLLEDFSRLKARIERYIQDEVNKRLSVIDATRSQIAELYERLDAVQQKLSELESLVRNIYVQKAKISSEVQESTRIKKPYKTGIERLKEEKVVFESKLPPRIQHDRLFAYFEREGAVVLRLTRERIAIDPEYWKEFKQRLLSLSTNVEDEIRNVLGDKGFELWKTLYSNNAIIFDSRARKWKFVPDTVP